MFSEVFRFALWLNILSRYSNFTGMPPNLLTESGCIMNTLLQGPLRILRCGVWTDLSAGNFRMKLIMQHAY